MSVVHRSTGLEVEAAHGRSVVHCIEGGHFVHSHRWHLQYCSYFVHDADTREPMLSLAEVQKRHDSRLLILRWVSFEDFGDELLVDGVEFEGYGWIVVVRVSMLRCLFEGQMVHVFLEQIDSVRVTYDLECFTCHAGCGG